MTDYIDSLPLTGRADYARVMFELAQCRMSFAEANSIVTAARHASASGSDEFIQRSYGPYDIVIRYEGADLYRVNVAKLVTEEDGWAAPVTMIPEKLIESVVIRVVKRLVAEGIRSQ